MNGQSIALLSVLALFFLYLAWRFLQVRSVRRRHGGPALDSVRAKVREARAATEPAVRAQRFVEVGDLAQGTLRDPGLAVAYYLRALRADPGSAHAIEALRGTLSRSSRASSRRLERVYWRLLSRIPAEGPTRTAWLEVWKALAELYGRGYRSPVRARAIRALLDQMGGGAKRP
jgi:hypothetical protein